MPFRNSAAAALLLALAALSAARGQNSSTVSLLFPAVSHQDGFDTRLAIHNTSGDDPSLTPRAGACALEYYGAVTGGFAPPADRTTASVSPGGHLDLQLSAIAPDFAGYIVASCDFPAAAGVAILSDGSVSYRSPAETIARDNVPLPLQVKPLLFSFATNAPGLDTRIVIANTTRDKLGATPIAGTCRIDYFGQNAQASQSSFAIPSGGRLEFTLSQGNPDLGIPGAPGFVGYLTAACDFARARGLAMVTQYADPGQPAGASAVVAGYGLTPEPLDIPIIVNPIEPDPAAPPHAGALLLPFASTRGALETELSLSNTSLDALGTFPEPGSCTIEYFGDQSSPSVVPQTLSLAASEQVMFPLSAGAPSKGIAAAPGFQGYLTISCDFERARADALLSSAAGAQIVSSLALAGERLAIPRQPQPGAPASTFVSSAGGDDWVVTLANTSIDGFGTAATDGGCLIQYQGSPASAAAAVPLPAGSVRRFLLSRGLPALGLAGAPGFQGYLSTSCDFGAARVVDYRTPANPDLAEFCDVDGASGVSPDDVIALTGRLSETVPLGDPADPDGDGMITDADVQFCNTLSDPITPPPPPPPPPPPAATPSADLGVELEASPPVAQPGRRLEIRVRVRNAGPAAAENAAAAVDLPSNLLLAAAPPECSADGSRQTCALGTLPAGAALTLAFSGTVSAFTVSGAAASASVSSSTSDPAGGNNSASLSAPLSSQADIAANAYFIPLGGASGRLTVSVTNRGPAAANGVRLEARLAGPFELQDVPRGCAYSGRRLTCALGGLVPGRTRAFLLDVRVDASAQGPLVTTVSGSSATSDHKPDNNTYTLEAP